MPSRSSSRPPHRLLPNRERKNGMSAPPSKTLVQITTVPMSLGFFTGQIGYMKARGFEIQAISSPGADLKKFAEREQVAVYAVRMSRRIAPLRDLVAIFHLWRKLRRIRPHIVHAHMSKAGLLGAIAAWLARVPVCIYHNHGMALSSAKGYKRILLRWAEKTSSFFAHEVIYVAYSVRDAALAECLCPKEKMKVILSINGLDAAGRFNPSNVGIRARARVRLKHGIPADAFVVGFVGRIFRIKGLVEVVTAWNTLSELYDSLHLLVVGDFDLRDPLPQEVERRLRNDPRIHLTGFIDDTPPLYTAMDLLVLPSYHEGLGYSLIEASAMTLPVVATRIPGCVDAVEDGVTGMLVPPRDAAALADAIRTYLNHPELRRKHGQAGRQRVLRDFRPEAIWEALYQEYVRLLREKGLPSPPPRPGDSSA